MNLRRKAHTMRSQRGMTLIELMIALTVLTVGLAALLGLLMTAIASNNRNQLDTGATLAAQAVLESIAAQPGGNDITMTDCAGNVYTVKTAPDNTVTVAPNSSTTVPPGNVDFTQSRSGITTGYSMYYVSCGTGGQQSTYDIRWNIQTIASGTGYSEKLITVGAAQTAAANAQGTSAQAQFLIPVTLRTISATGN
jgi:prepilin-type N-terminal cleavage/methylation domain-containing protein